MKARKSVALIIETASHYGRQLLSGMLRYKTERTDWKVLLEERDLNAAPPLWLKDWEGDGIICRLTTPAISEMAIQRDIPFVELTDRLPEKVDLVTMRSDDAAIGTLGAEHFLERGFRNFAFCGLENEAWSERRAKAFRQRLEADSLSCERIDLPYYISNEPTKEQRRLTDWLERLPKPIGVMAGNDIRAKHVLDACITAKIAVPERVGVIGVDNDELVCKFCEPTLSSIVPSSKELGYRSAEALDKLMRGEEVNPLLQLVDPLDVYVRESSDTMAIEDTEMANALVFIRNHACQGITVEDVLAHTKLSRSSLERRTRKLLGRSPQQEIRKAQLKRVKMLLVETDLLIESIGAQCGFEHPEYLHVMFKREFKMTPGEYRKLARR
ncbi:MAG: DNA-binding transcriptional regulator [Planctomycetota bacterium]